MLIKKRGQTGFFLIRILADVFFLIRMLAGVFFLIRILAVVFN